MFLIINLFIFIFSAERQKTQQQAAKLANDSALKLKVRERDGWK